MKNREWLTIPILKYLALEPTLIFWETLGFAITYRQDRPYKYAVVERGGYQLHFVHTKGADASQAYYGCLLVVSDVQNVYQEFSRSLKAKFGKVPATGLPRISRMKPMQTRFIVTDPSGNSVIVLQGGDRDQADYKSENTQNLTELGKSVVLAVRLRDFKEDYLAAAKMLDHALKKHQMLADRTELAEALVIRIELARVLADEARRKECTELLSGLKISKEKLLKLGLKHNWSSDYPPQ